MNIDNGLIVTTVQAGRAGLKRLSDAGITEELVRDGSARAALTFVREHAREHGEMPSLEFLYQKTGFEPEEFEDPQTVFIQEVRDRELFDMQVAFANDFGKLVNDRKVHDAQTRLDEYQRTVRGSAASPAKARSVWSYGPQVLEMYEDAKAGIMGIQTPWDTVNAMTRGWSPGDFIVFAARLGTGKTWSMLQMAHHAYTEGYRVLFISPEMADVKLAQRLYSLHLQYAYEEVRSGRLGEFKEATFREKVDELRGLDGFEVMGAGVRYTMQIVEDAIALERPDLVVIDGLYLIRGPGRNRSERVANVADDCKMVAGDYGIPILSSTQFNREVKANDESTVDVQNIGLSDVIGWNADAAFALYQTEDHKHDNEMLLKPLKIREGGVMRDVLLRWDFRRMVFTELAAEGDLNEADYDRYAVEPPQERADGVEPDDSVGGGEGEAERPAGIPW